MIIITNNPIIKGGGHIVLEKTSATVLLKARDMIHRGHKLLIHPRYGNIQPRLWRYRSLILGEEKGSLDMLSLELIEDAIARLDADRSNSGMASESLMCDYQLIDADIINAALQQLSNGSPANLKSNEGR
jgi:hypothetical protein